MEDHVKKKDLFNSIREQFGAFLAHKNKPDRKLCSQQEEWRAFKNNVKHQDLGKYPTLL